MPSAIGTTGTQDHPCHASAVATKAAKAPESAASRTPTPLPPPPSDQKTADPCRDRERDGVRQKERDREAQLLVAPEGAERRHDLLGRAHLAETRRDDARAHRLGDVRERQPRAEDAHRPEPNPVPRGALVRLVRARADGVGFLLGRLCLEDGEATLWAHLS